MNTTTFQVNDRVRWRNCPAAIAQFAESRVLEVSECGQFARLGFIYHWVKVSELELSECPSAARFWGLYQ